MASGKIDAKYPPLTEASVNSSVAGATDFAVTVYKIGNIALCSYKIKYSSEIASGTNLFTLPYTPKKSLMVMIMDADGATGFPANIDGNGTVTAYNTLKANKYYEGSFVYFANA